MLRILKSEANVVVPVRAVFERRASDAYQVEEECVLAAPLLERELQIVTLEPLLEDDVQPVEEVEGGLEEETEVMTSHGETTRVKFRQALFDVDDPETFWAGVVGGQVTAVEESHPLTGAQVFALFEDAVRDLEFSETWLAGYFLGLSDALLRRRKVYPRVYAARLKPLSRGGLR